MATTKPGYLLVPPLYEEGTATVSWENTPDANRYELDISFNEHYDSAGRGKAWSDMELCDWVWSDQSDSSGFTWKQMEELPAQGLFWRNLEFMDRTWEEWESDPAITWKWMQEHPVTFTVYSGPGRDLAAPDQGRTWGNMDSATWLWSDQEEPGGKTWKEIELLPSIGLSWYQHEQDDHTWSGLEAVYADWREIENLPPRGLCWASLEGKWLTWAEREAAGGNSDGLTWRELEQLPPDNQTHKGTDIDLPLYTKSSMLRVRALDDQENASEYLTTAMIGHLPRSLAKYKVPCLHIPALYEGKSAEISWGDLYGASGYVLERNCGGGYEERYDGAGTLIPHPTGCKKLQEHYYGPDCKRHLACRDQVPYYKKTARYRIKGYNTTDSSQYLESAVVPIVPVFYREDKVLFTVNTNQTVYLHISSNSAYDFENVDLTLRYDHTAFQLVDLAAQTEEHRVATGIIPGTNLNILSMSNGELRFRFNTPLTQNRSYSGLIAILELKSLRNTRTEVSLR